MKKALVYRDPRAGLKSKLDGKEIRGYEDERRRSEKVFALRLALRLPQGLGQNALAAQGGGSARRDLQVRCRH